MAALQFPIDGSGTGSEADLSNGLSYYKNADGSWVSVGQPYTFPNPDDYVLRAGDKMTGSLQSPRFVANYNLEDLGDL